MNKLHSTHLILLVIVAVLLLPLFVFSGLCFIIYGLIIKNRTKDILSMNHHNINEDLKNTQPCHRGTNDGCVIDHE